MEAQFYKPEQIAEILSVPKQQVYAMFRTKKLPYKRIGRHYRVSKVLFERWAVAN